MANKLSDHLQATLSFFVIGTFIGIVILILIIIGYHRDKRIHSHKMIKSIQYLSGLHVIYWIIHHLIFVFVYTHFALKEWILKETYTALWYTYVCGINLTTTLAECSLFVIILARLYYTFKESRYKLPNYMVIIFLILIGIASFMLLFGLLIYSSVFEDISASLVKSGSKIYVSASFIFAFVGLALVFTFTKKLIQLTLYQSNKESQYKLFQIAIKNSLLSIISVVSFNIYLFTLTLLDLGVIKLDPWNDKDAWLWLYIVYFNEVIVVAIEMICMYLSLNNTSNLYDRCCKPCHCICEVIMVKIINNPT